MEIPSHKNRTIFNFAGIKQKEVSIDAFNDDLYNYILLDMFILFLPGRLTFCEFK